ncbi:MAG: tetratricopeptide repeat protein [Gammaproteobacteria bacterium]|nr:tetratricopeptide repeat protein [Gammaproteobacteria bacterium]
MKARYFILAIVFGALMAYAIKDQNGYVLIAWDKSTLEMRLWLAIFFLFIFFAITFVSAWLLFSLKRTKRQFSRWAKTKGNRKAQNFTLSGLIALTEGHWEKAEMFFRKANEKSNIPLINFILAAKAAQEQGNHSARDLYLSKASECEPEASIAVSVTQADLQFESGQYEQALATLNHLWVKNKKHPYVLKLLAKCYLQLGDYEKLFDLLPALKKRNVLKAEVIKEMEHECVKRLLERSSLVGCEQMQATWQRLPSEFQKSTSYLIFYIQHLIDFSALAEAESVARQALKRGYQTELFYLYGKATGRDSQSQLAFAETFINEGKLDWQLYLTLGRLCLVNELWGKAKNYLNKSLELQSNLEASRLLIEVCEKTNEPLTSIFGSIKQAIDRELSQDLKA